MICPKCGRALLAREGILQAGRKYHRQCWTCAFCSVPLTSWIRQQPLSNDYVCNSCHIKKYGLREGLVVVNWKKQAKSIVPINPQASNIIDDILLI